MQTYDFSAAGRHINGKFRFIRYEQETGGAVNPGVRLRVDGADFGVWLPGDYCELDESVGLIEVTPVAGAAGDFRVGSGRFGSSRFLLTGQPSTAIAATVSARATFTNTQKIVTNASATLLAANASRNYLMIQNNDPTGVIFVAFGVAATLAAGVRIAAGGYWEWDSAAPINSVQAIGSIASNANIVVLEG